MPQDSIHMSDSSTWHILEEYSYSRSTEQGIYAYYSLYLLSPPKVKNIVLLEPLDLGDLCEYMDTMVDIYTWMFYKTY